MPLRPLRSLRVAAFGAAFLMLAASSSAGCDEWRSVIDHLTSRDGRSCLVGAGTDRRLLKAQPKTMNEEPV